MRQVALRLGTVPELLAERDQQLLVEPIGIAPADEPEIRIEVDAPVQQRRVVGGRHGEEAAREVRGDRHDRDAEDAALASAGVVGLGGVDDAGPAGAELEGGMRVQAGGGVAHQPPHQQVVQEALVQPFRDEVELREILHERQDGGHEVVARHALHVDAADDEVVGVREHRERADLRAGAEEAVAPERRPAGRAADGDARDVDHERHGRVAVLRRHAADEVQARRGRIGGHEERRLERPRHAGEDVGVASGVGRTVVDVRDRERRRGERERLVAHRDDPAGERLRAGGREVPGKDELLGVDAVGGERLEERREGRQPRADRRAARRAAGAGDVGLGTAVAQRPEGEPRADRIAERVDQIANGDDVARPVLEPPARSDDERLPRHVVRVGVHLGEVEDAVAGGGLHEDRRVIGVERADVVRVEGDVRGREVDRRAGVREERHDHRSRAEAVERVPVGRVDVHAVRVRREAVHRVVHTQSRRRRRIGDQEA